MGGDGRLVGGVPADGKQTAMDGGMQRLDPTVQHLRKTGDAGDVRDGQARRAQGEGCAAGGQQLDVAAGQGRGELDQAGLVRNAQQGTPNGGHGQLDSS